MNTDEYDLYTIYKEFDLSLMEDMWIDFETHHCKHSSKKDKALIYLHSEGGNVSVLGHIIAFFKRFYKSYEVVLMGNVASCAADFALSSYKIHNPKNYFMLFHCATRYMYSTKTVRKPHQDPIAMHVTLTLLTPILEQIPALTGEFIQEPYNDWCFGTDQLKPVPEYFTRDVINILSGA